MPRPPSSVPARPAQRTAVRCLALALAAIMSLTGCVSVRVRSSDHRASPEDALGTYLLLTAMTGAATNPDFLNTLYPLRSQLVTYAVIGFHRDHGTWPITAQDLLAYAASSPANPPLLQDAVAGYTANVKPDGSVVYSTLEDRQRGRDFTVSPDYHVTFPMPKYPFASGHSAVATRSAPSTVSFDWGSAIAEAIRTAVRAK